jgi:hypothetical protein
MFTKFFMAILGGSIGLANAAVAPSSDPPDVYVELIVKACPSDRTEMQTDRPDAVRGYYAKPVNQGVVYNDERSPTRAERESAFATMHCIDVPVPPDVIMGTPLTRQACMGHVGYMIALQYLQQNAAYAQSFPDIGEWECIEHPFPVAGVAGM